MTPRRSTGSESRNVAILLGAGSSIPARFPSTTELTDRVLSGEGVIKCSDDLYYLDANGTDQADSNVCRVKHVIRRLYAHADRYYSARRGRQINYEDLFFLARQAADDVQGELENPAVESFVRDLRIYIAQLPKGPDPIYLLEETCYYIADVVRCLLCSPNMIEVPRRPRVPASRGVETEAGSSHQSLPSADRPCLMASRSSYTPSSQSLATFRSSASAVDRVPLSSGSKASIRKCLRTQSPSESRIQ